MRSDAATPSDGGLRCPNCGDGHGPDDIFCESCGYDFLTGSLPDDEALVAPAPAGAPTAPPPDEARPREVRMLTVEVAVDTDYFAKVVTGGELDLPDPVPPARTVEVAAGEIHIGRTSESRNIHPDLDIASLTGDPAVSSRHAVIREGTGAGYTITDTNSTNGTTLGLLDAPLLDPDTPTPFEVGVPIYVGAWTRITIH